ncbi:MAG: CYTH domain-containing protein [Bacilli bacterium]
MASNIIEIESKVLLSRKDYEKVKKTLDFLPTVKLQSNYYLDSDDRILKQFGIIVRLRTREGNAKLTLKAPLSEGLLEKNQTMNLQEATSLVKTNIIPKGEIRDFLEILHINPDNLKILAELTTERRECEYNSSKVNISKNTYGDVIDYEIECDSDSRIKSDGTLKEICDNLKIKFELNNISKEERAINEALNSK